MENKNIVNEIVVNLDEYKISECKLSDFSFKDDSLVGSPEAFALAVRVHRQNSRQGTLGCKGRSDLTSRSNKKPWRQKGTGRARAGTARSPLWRGGAVSLRPRMRVRELSLNRGVSNSALRYLMNIKFNENKIYSLNWIPNKSCSLAYKILKNNKFEEKKFVLFYEINDYLTFYSFANIQNINLVSYDAVHPYAISKGSLYVFLEKDKSLFDLMVSSWIN